MIRTKINIIKGGSKNETSFGDLSIGDFYLDQLDNLCQKIDEIEDDNGCILANAVTIEHGSYRDEIEDCKVIPIRNINITYNI